MCGGEYQFLTPSHSPPSSITLQGGEGAGVSEELKTEGNEETNSLMGWLDNVLADQNSRCAEGCVYKHLECG